MEGRDPVTPLFISYSANYEDVLLHRIFSGVPNGFYVDVGAAHPVMENDTKALYDQGWSGITIEPNPTLFAELQVQRPRDRSLNVALSNQVGEALYNEVVGTGLSTLDAKEAERCRGNGYEIVERRVTTTTLAEVLSSNPPSRFDLLKVDVEGFEEQVLESNDWDRFRPSVIVVEVTYPETPRRRETQIRGILGKQGYRFVHFDGLNDFYAESNFGGADGAFDLPPNVFDRFVPFQLLDQRRHAHALENQLAEAQHYNSANAAAITPMRDETDRLHAEAVENRRQTANRDAELQDTRSDITRLLASLKEAMGQLAHFSQMVERSCADREELLLLRIHTLHVTCEHGHAARAYERQVLANQLLMASTSWRITWPIRMARRVYDKALLALQRPGV